MPVTTKLESAIRRLVYNIKDESRQVTYPEERRAHPRFRGQLRAKIELLQPDDCPDLLDEPLHTWIGNISAGGLAYLSPKPAPVGQQLLITLDTRTRQLRIPATVIHSTGSASRYRVGVKFNQQQN